MAKWKKTIKLEELVTMVNNFNRTNIHSAETRVGWNRVVIEFLNKNGARWGKRYLTQKEVPDGHKPGIDKDKEREWLYGGLSHSEYRTFVDTTRKQFSIEDEERE